MTSVRFHANNKHTTLNGALTNVATSMTVTSAAGWPAIGANQTIRATLQSGSTYEIIEITDDATTPTFTITRGMEGTTAVAWANGSLISLRATADSFDRKQDQIASVLDVINFGDAISLEIPNSAAPSFSADGQIALDTTITGHNGLLKYRTGGADMVMIAMPVANLLTTDTYVISYNAASSSFQMVAGGSGSNTFTTFSVAGQSDVVADTTTDIMTFVAGTGMTITTNATTDTITFNSTGSGDVVGPAAATAGAVALFNGTTGKLIKDGGVLDALINTLTVGLGANAVASNTAFGLGALAGGTLSGANNIGIGKAAGDALTSGADNICIGTDAGGTITTSTQNVFIGSLAGGTGTTANSHNVCVGYQASGGASAAGGGEKVCVGYQAGKNSGSSSCVYIGYQAGISNSLNLAVAIGYQALGDVNCTSQGSVCIGYQAGIRVTGNYNIFVGVSTGGTSAANVSGTECVGIGYTSLAALTTASNVTAYGAESMSGLTTGGNNTGIGFKCGVTGPTGAVTLTTGTSNTMLGYRAGVDTLSTVGVIAIGCDAVATKATGTLSTDNGPGIAIGSAGFMVGFRGDGTIYSAVGASAGYWRVKINGTQYKIQLFADA